MSQASLPAVGESWWKKLLKLEPVAVQAVIRAVFVFATVLLGGFGIAVPEGLEPWVLAVVLAAYAVLEAITTLLARLRATPNAKVVQEVTEDGRVLAGEASPMPTGTLLTYVETDLPHDPDVV